MARRIHTDLTYEMTDDMGNSYKNKLDLLRRSCLNKFKADQRGVQITANIAKVVKGLVEIESQGIVKVGVKVKVVVVGLFLLTLNGQRR